jgi:hypothetical protein
VSDVSPHLSVTLFIAVHLKINKQNYEGATQIKRRLNSVNASYHSVFSSAVYKHKNWNKHNFNFAPGSAWV